MADSVSNSTWHWPEYSPVIGSFIISKNRILPKVLKNLYTASSVKFNGRLLTNNFDVVGLSSEERDVVGFGLGLGPSKLLFK